MPEANGGTMTSTTDWYGRPQWVLCAPSFTLRSGFAEQGFVSDGFYP